MAEKAYTTFQISRFCNVNHRTVLYWIRQKKIRAFKTAGGHSRVREGDLKTFLDEHEIPMPPELEQASHVLIVDDEPEMLTMLEQIVVNDEKLSGKVRVSKSANGIDALMLLGKEKADCLILDIFMPYLDGFEVCRRIRGNPDLAKTRILAISGNMTTEVMERVRMCGADECISKPFDVSDLRKRVRKALTGKLK